MEKKCNTCGKTLPIEMFPINKGYRRNKCKLCCNAYRDEWRKSHPRSDKEKARDLLRCGLKREESKANTGRTYRNRKEAERARAYALKYEEEHKDDERYRETKLRCQRNARERQKIKEQVSVLDEFFNNDLSF